MKSAKQLRGLRFSSSSSSSDESSSELRSSISSKMLQNTTHNVQKFVKKGLNSSGTANDILKRRMSRINNDTSDDSIKKAKRRSSITQEKNKHNISVKSSTIHKRQESSDSDSDFSEPERQVTLHNSHQSKRNVADADSSKPRQKNTISKIRKSCESEDSESDSSSSSEDSEPTVHKSNKSPKTMSNLSRNTSKIASILEKFIEDNQKLTEVNTDLEEFGDNMELCILQVPRNIEPNFSLNNTIAMKGETIIKIDKKKYVLKPKEGIKGAVALIANNLKLIHPVSYLKLETYEKSKTEPLIANHEESKVIEYDNIKTNHPLFGDQYVKKINLKKEIQKKLNDAIKSVNKESKRKKRIKNESMEKDEAIFKMLERQSLNNTTNQPVGTKKRNNKSKRDSMINSTLMSDYRPKFDVEISRIDGNSPKKVIKQEVVSEDDVKKKKKRKKYNEIDVTVKKIKKEDDRLIFDILNSVKDELNTEKKRKKKHSFSDNNN